MSDPAVTELVTDWVSVEETAERIGLSSTQVRRLVRDGDLLALPVPGCHGPQVPALFLAEGQLVKGLSGTLTLLRDARHGPQESLVWLFTPEPSLPGRPIDALRANRGAEVRRRAQAMA